MRKIRACAQERRIALSCDDTGTDVGKPPAGLGNGGGRADLWPDRPGPTRLGHVAARPTAAP
eukprot:9044809-Pyramimonas_sp.AAC.1